MDALQTIRMRFGHNNSSPKIICKQKDICSLDLKKILLPFFEKTLGKAPEEVYCYNAPLAFLEAEKAMTITTQKAFDEYLLRSGRCFPTLAPQAGDIGRVYDRTTNRTRHGFIYITENLVYEKANSGGDNPYEFKSKKSALAGYLGLYNSDLNGNSQFTGFLERCIENGSEAADYCETKTTFYSCL